MQTDRKQAVTEIDITDRQTESRQIHKQTWQTEKTDSRLLHSWIDMINKQIYRRRHDRQTDTQMDMTDRHTDRRIQWTEQRQQNDSQKDRTDRQTDGQTDRRTDRGKDVYFDE